MRQHAPLRLVLPAILLGVALLAPAARAENARLQAAIRLYQRAELDAAMAELKAAEESQTKSDDDLVQILIYRGLIYAETGQQGQMSESFKRALAMRPWAEAPADASPRLQKMFNDARREVWGSPGIKAWPVKKAAPAATPPADAPKTDGAPAPAPSPAPAPAPAPPADAPPDVPPSGK